MDVVNTMDLIIPKMRKQMYTKGIYSLDIFYEAIEKEGKFFPIRHLDTFLGKFGIFLKSQEVTALLNSCKHSETQIDLVRMIYLFRTEIPNDIINILNKIFDKLSDGQASMDVEEVLLHLDEKEHPQFELLNQNIDFIRSSVIRGMRLIIGNKKLILREEFLEFHFNIFWAIPDYMINGFRRQLPLMWGIKKLN